MRLIAAILGTAGALFGVISARALISIQASGLSPDMLLSPDSELLGLMALALSALGVVGVTIPLGGRLSSLVLLLSAVGFWHFLPEHAIPATPLFLVAAVLSILSN